MNVPRMQLRPDFSVPRIIKGNWQIADDHSASIPDDDALYAQMSAFVDAGITAFDCGDIYYGVEERIGRFIERFRRERGAEAARRIAVHTKYIPGFLVEGELRTQTRQKVEAVIDRSLRRLRVERLDLVQLHWWEYKIPGNVETALILKQLQQAGKIHHIGGTNYNVAELRKMIEAGVDVVVNQVQYSITDRRPQHGMADYCREHDVQLLCYGALGGGLFSRKWLGIPDPGRPAFENVSLDKYYRIVVDFGGWALFQELLRVLDGIAAKHAVSIPTVASRYVLEQQAVAAIIQGARHARHIQENVRVFSFALDASDRAQIEAILSRSKGPTGDCYDLDRAENRDALENVATEYFDVEDGKLVSRKRAAVTVAEPYGHHLAH
jgi:aryl-alcohol dehydrogenase-like predicted oxidoreductase